MQNVEITSEIAIDSSDVKILSNRYKVTVTLRGLEVTLTI